jgi:hypothetical protein
MSLKNRIEKSLMIQSSSGAYLDPLLAAADWSEI